MPIAQINGQGLFYEDSGGSGPAVVMLHGFMFDQSMFDKQVAALAPQYRCVRFDARGFGQTQWDGKTFSLYDTAADCVGLMDHLGIEKATILGMSQGGYAALRVAVKYPQRVQALVFISTYNGVDPEDVKAIYRSMRDTWQNEGPAPVVSTLLDLFLGPQADVPELWTEWKPKWEARSNADIEHTMNNLIDRDDVTQEQVDTVTAPALVIHSMADKGIPIALGEALYKSLPNSKRMLPVADAPHAANITHAEQVNKVLLEFLNEYGS